MKFAQQSSQSIVYQNSHQHGWKPKQNKTLMEFLNVFQGIENSFKSVGQRLLIGSSTSVRQRKCAKIQRKLHIFPSLTAYPQVAFFWQRKVMGHSFNWHLEGRYSNKGRMWIRSLWNRRKQRKYFPSTSVGTPHYSNTSATRGGFVVSHNFLLFLIKSQRPRLFSA